MSILKSRAQLYHSHSDETIQKLLSLPKDKQRFIYYTDKIGFKEFTTANVSIYDDKLCLSISSEKINFNNGFYLINSGKTGFTYDYKTKKIRFWFGSNIKTFIRQNYKIFELFLRYKGVDWLNKEKPLFNLLNKTILEKILSGKITNPINLCDCYIKTSLKAKVPHKLFYNYIKKKGGSLYFFNMCLKVSDNHENLLKRLVKTDDLQPDLINDLINQCLALNRKINFNWSNKRLKSEHDKLTEEMIKIELEYMANHKLNYIGELILPDYCSLITTQQDLYIEGVKQKHCIYTNYWEQIKNKRYFAIKVELPNERISVGIQYNNPNKWYNYPKNETPKFIINQIYGYKNSNPSNETRVMIQEWLDKEETQKFFEINHKNIPIAQNTFINYDVEELALF